MNLIELFASFKSQEQGLEYLEKVRWRGHPTCPYCQDERVHRHASGDRAEQRWQCQNCHRAFSVTVGTIFHRTHVPLKNWFLVIALMLNAKKSASAYQIARDIGMRRATVWSMMHRIRVAMAEDPDQNTLLHGIVEADETYIGGKPRKGNRKDDDKPHKRGRGTDKTPVIGAVERGGRVIARVAKKRDLSIKGLSKFITSCVDTKGSLLITDEFRGYNAMRKLFFHAQVNHEVSYADGLIHTNSIEGFWSLVKRALYGQHHHYSKKYMPLYISEACYKYNKRSKGDTFENFIGVMVRA
jgi:transposase-like protein